MNKKSDTIERVRNARCDILGFGISNRPLVRVLEGYGAHITIHDKKDTEQLGDEAKQFKDSGVEFITGENYLDCIDGDVIFRSPGFRPDLPQISTALSRGSYLTSEMEMFIDMTDAQVIGITGSDGKTTTTTLTSMMLTAQAERNRHGHVYVGGNIGTPLLPYTPDMTADDFAVVELSSFQLQTMTCSPSRAVITNITPNHLNWHTGMDEYIRAKCNIYLHSPCKLLVTNTENDICLGLAAECHIPVTLFSSHKTSFSEFPSCTAAIYERDGMIIYSDGNKEISVLRTSDIKLPGRHNVENYMAAIGVTWGLVDFDIIDSTARTFGGVEHRLEFVRELDGVKYYNSSIDSTPTRTAAALSALKEKPIIICGGYDKHIPFVPLADALCAKAKAVVLTGATAKKIMQALRDCPDFDSSSLPVNTEKVFNDAINFARSIAKPGDTVLLSPACASFDAFANFEERGKAFKKTVNEF